MEQWGCGLVLWPGAVCNPGLRQVLGSDYGPSYLTKSTR